MAAGGVGRDADLAGGAEGWSAFKGDDVGGRRIIEEVSVELGEGGVGEEDEGEFAGGHGRERRGGFWRAPRRIWRSQGSRGKIGVEGVDHAGDSAAVEAQARVAVMLLLTLRGTPTIYYGDEIGLADVAIRVVEKPFKVGKTNVPAGSLVVPASAAAPLRSAVGELGLSAIAAPGNLSAPTHEMAVPRTAIRSFVMTPSIRAEAAFAPLGGNQ